MPKAKLTTPAEDPSHPYPAQARNALTTIQAGSAAGGVSQYAGYPSQPMLSQPMYSQPIHGGGYPQHNPPTLPMGSPGGHVNPYIAAYGPMPGGPHPTQAPMYYVPAYNHPHGTPGAEPGHPQVYYVAAYPPGYGSPQVAGPPSGNTLGAAYSPPPGYGNPHGLPNTLYQPPPSQPYSQMTAGGPGVPAPNPYAHSQGSGAPKAEPSAPTVATQRQPPPAQTQSARSQVNASQPAYSPPPVLTQPLSRQGTMNQSMATLPPSSPPMSSQVIKAEPTPSQPTSSQVSQHPMFREMSQSQPAQHQPLISQTPQRQPMSSQPPSSQPPLSQPSFSQPTSSQPPSSQPPASQGTPGQPKQRWFPPWYRRPDETYYDESLWGQSNIPIGSRILKGESTKKYHLQYYELNGLKFDTEHFTLRGGEPGTKMWYNERDVERAAWRVYGGPLGFEKYLREAHEVYQAKDAPYKAKVTFSYPDAYVYVVSPEHAFANEMAIEEAQRAAEAAEAKKRADALNESKWRKSALTARKKIMKTDALKKYHLQDYDLVGLDVEYKKFNIPGRRTQGTKHMYKEKEVELVAWRKHGGPDGFAAHMRNRR